MARCDECRHWSNDLGKDFAEVIGTCTRAHAFWDRSEWKDTDAGYQRVLTPEAAGDMMFCQDGSDYHAILLTKPEFFCAHWDRTLNAPLLTEEGPMV